MWTKSPTQFRITKGEVHVWKASLKTEEKTFRKYYNILSEDEQIRANRLRFAKDRVQFVSARGVLRQLIARYLSMDPAAVRFQYTPFGKPYLLNNHRLEFNVSHSGGMALFGFAMGRMIGIDIECVHTDIEFASVANQFFSPYEIKALFSLPVSQQAQSFYLCWTRKEALLKAMGNGLSLPLDQFEVTLLPSVPAEILNIRWNPMERDKWSMYSLSPAPGFVGALVIEGKSDSVHRFTYIDADK